MPNWCENSISITGKKTDIDALLKLVGDEFDFNALIPCPKELKAESVGRTAGNTVVHLNPRSMIFHKYDSKCFKTPMEFSEMWQKKQQGGNTAADAINNGHRACKNCMVKPRLIGQDFDKPLEEGAALVKKYGFDNWYDWNIANWGTKWLATDIHISRVGGAAEIFFNTAWSPPEPIYKKIVELFPNLMISWHYNEPGNGFSGDFETGVENDFADPCECGDPECPECSVEIEQ